MAKKVTTEETRVSVDPVQPHVLHSPLVILIEKFAWHRRRKVAQNRGQAPGAVIHNSDGSTTRVVSVKAM
jgi:hypothetical protein